MLNIKNCPQTCQIWATVFVLGLVWFSIGDAIAGSSRLVLTGSSTVAPLMREIARRFEARYSGVRIDVQTGGSSRGINDARRGVANIGMVSRELMSDEDDLHGFTVAVDGVGLIVHRDNPVMSLDKWQITGIYTGKIKRWDDVGGADAQITVINKAEGHSTLMLFLNYFQLRSSAIKPHVVIGDNAQGIKTVIGNPHAIGYVSIGAAAYEVQRGAPLHLLSLDGVDASVANVRNGVFPLVRPLNLVTLGEPHGLARKFIAFSRSDEVHDLIEAQYFVPVDIN